VCTVQEYKYISNYQGIMLNLEIQQCYKYDIITNTNIVSTRSALGRMQVAPTKVLRRLSRVDYCNAVFAVLRRRYITDISMKIINTQQVFC